MSSRRVPNAREDAATGGPARETDVRVGPPAEEPIEYQLVRAIVRKVEELVLSETSRGSLDADNKLLTELVQRMIREDYPDQRPTTMAVFRSAYRVLSSPTNPTSLDSDYLVYAHVKNLARSVGALADVLDSPRSAAGFIAQPGLPPERRLP
ncbi:hypothetical protein [Streptomyces endophyticus]|uniref:Uncharacterized protein n=1 Tax=Streptomyces endophyticus TaxID=714166 RepID=A0ABU6FB89_9ACTN|nr:hypothetical protein [Streptomyces endophyticus]MEB8341304.1 hypothetical protein [Streptomyces endophyticus]